MAQPRVSLFRTFAALLVAATLAACGGNDSGPPPPSVGSATLGAAGGTVDGPDGTRLEVPASALQPDVTFRIARDASGAPELLGLNAVSPVYAVTPHGQGFEGSARLSIPLSAAPLLPAGAKPLLLKAEPGGKWRIMQNVSDDPSRMAVDIDGLSYYVIGSCTSTDPTWTIGAVDCPGVDHRLEVDLSTANGTRILVGTGVNTPAWSVTGAPQTLFMGAFFTRPAGTNRTDQLALVGLPGGFNNTGFRSTWTNQVYDIPPSVGSYGQRFQVTIDPAQVSGAALPNGKMLRVRAYASYSTTAFRVGQGNVVVGFEFQTDFPILVSYRGPQPTISQQPANLGVIEGQPASFTVQAGITPAAPLAYQWSRRAGASATFAPIAGATAASYNLATTALSDDGAQFQVAVCALPSRCIPSSPATLSVTLLAVAPVFTQNPANLSVAAGQTASFSVTATGLPLPQLKWQSELSNGSFADVAGVTNCGVTAPPSTGTSASATCTIGPVAVGQSGQRFRAVASNAAAPGGTFSSVATLTVSAAPQAPAITQPPAAQTTTVGGRASFTVAATGTAPLAYTWQQSGTNLPTVSGGFNAGACSGTVTYSNGNATITLTGLSAGCNGVPVNVTVSNGVNPAATSIGATLTVNPATQGLSLLAGDIGGWGSLDGTGATARVMFSLENGIAFDTAGNAYFSEAISGRLRKITPAGVVTTIAGATTPLLSPAGVAVDSAGNVFVAERGIGRILRITPAGVLSVWTPQGSLSLPRSLAIDANDNLYVTSETSSGDSLISRVSPAQVISPFHAFASGGRVGAIAVAADLSVFGVGQGALFGTIVRITPAGAVSVLAGAAGEQGNLDGTGAAARFFGVGGLAILGGDLFAADGSTVRRITLTGTVTTVSGGVTAPFEPRDGAGTAARYEGASAIAAGPTGDLLIGDGATMRKLAPLPNYFAITFAGKRVQVGTTDGAGAAARFNCFCDVALDAAGNAYLASGGGLRKVTPGGTVTTIPVTPSLSSYSITFDASRGEFVAATGFAVWRVTTAGVATLLAGNPSAQAYVDGTGTEARFYQIGGLAVDAAGNVFVSESQSYTIRRITPAGVVTTHAGALDQPGTADGLAADARFLGAGGLAFDGGGNLFIASNLTIRRITPAGQVSTVAGTPNVLGSVDGTGAAARFREPRKLAFEPSGNLLISDGSTLRRLTPANVVTTVMGVDGDRAVRLGASPRLNYVAGLAVRPSGRIVLMSEAAVLEGTIP